MTDSNAVYTAHVSVTGGRSGHATSDDGVLDIDLAVPGASGHAGATNPEQLFAAGYAACFQNALMGISRRAGLDPSEGVIDASVSLLKGDSYRLAVDFKVKLPGATREVATQLVEQAHEICPYSNATRGNIDFTYEIVD